MTTGNSSTSRYFEYKDEKYAKFWEIDVSDVCVSVRYGKIGVAGQFQEKSFENISLAQKHAEKLISEKLKKGYVPKGVEGNDTGKATPVNSSVVKEPCDTNEAPAEFEALRRNFYEICDLLESESPSDLNRPYERQQFKEDFESGFKSGAWSWTPVTEKIVDDKIDRLGEVLMGPLFSSEDHPWPEQDKAPMAPLIQIDLRIASDIGGVQLGDGLLQVWMPKYEFAKPVFIRVVPRQDVDPLKLTPIVAVAEGLDPLQSRGEEWSDEVGSFVPSAAIQITGYSPKRFTFQIRFPIQSNYFIKNLTQREETSLRIKEFDKKIKPFLKDGPKGYDAGNCHLFGTFTPIQYKHDTKPTPLFCFESDEFGFYWGDGGNAQLFYELDVDGKVTFSFDWSCT